MRVVTLKGFDNNANIALNDAFILAGKYNFKYVCSIHLLYSMLRNLKVKHAFEEDTGKTAEEFKEVAMEFLQNETVDEGEHPELTIENITKEMNKVLQNTIDRGKTQNREVTILDLYEEIMAYSEAAIWDLLADIMGIDKDVVTRRLNKPLDSMPVTSKYAIDYNQLAIAGRFDPISSRDEVIESTLEILGRRIKNNPCLIGEAGVGKTAIVEGIAQRLVDGDVPNYLKGKHIISVDISGVVSGARYRGDFEERFNGILEEAASREDVILFFDEIHMIMSAGDSNEGAMSAANILKPAISRGDVQIIGATTTSEYKKFVEKDKALERRLQSINVPEPTVKEAIEMIKTVIHKYNEFHNSNITNEAIEAAVVLSDRYITDKRLPDKAITVLDETAARLKKLIDFNTVIKVDTSDVKRTISKITGIDINDMDVEVRSKVKQLSHNLEKHVIGQSKAVESVSRAIRRSKAGVKDPNKPIGSFLFVGPTGVGKTELTKALAIEFSGDIKNLIRFDMSEFMEKHSVSKLIGSPPGYVGYGEGGQLTETVRHNPYSIILFDEIEKAHPDVFNIMLQILDDGILTDSEGLKVDFKNTVIVMTSNAGYGADTNRTGRIGFAAHTDAVETKTDAEKQEENALKALENTFRPEFINRIDKVIIFNKLSKDECKNIVELMLNQLRQRLSDNKIDVDWTEDVVNYIIDIGYSDKYGARNLKRAIQENIEDKIADMIIDEEINENDHIKIEYLDKIIISVQNCIGRELNFGKELTTM